ncbi:MAG: hypothetical protein V8S88_05145 [Lachnospiraceae bacterium]|jgi:hypothetical protein|uniref:DUF5050 domain-containing protein n=1 Tax=Coprococcus hominis (ex Arizal et al. 2022) TaxID=2881262 RepID=A0ABS8FRT9_9FIRM|nr:hypothetical protein [Coprococcus hominis (ex Arizal et al. 2022)]RHO73773.1 hypothetical protein DW062_13835 [Clostridium sp. AF43-10]RHQ71406.1 hypothetical protein DWY08_07195 [Clostridium sp. AF23-8]RHS83533.1 hypothetical protein DW920_14920 [Clostridium sp. AM42-36]RHU85375.1 hypothetical protein DXC24_08880 [Clostridium sp. OM08-29]MCC2219956.1 hypothetical protein [Coprococcus hominis (ex Arizal et al. 2022)]
MEVEYVDNMVKWLYDDKEIIYETKGVEFATDVATAIYIELMFDGIYEYRFVGFSGKDICKYDDNNLLTIYDENAGKHEIQLEDINDVFILKEKIYVMNKRKSIIVYNTEGENKGLIVPPQGYIYSRFCNNSKLEVICEGDSLRADSFGRVDYKFEYNLFCNNWERKNVVY